MKYSFPAFENGFIRAAAASPALRVADCVYNAEQIIGVMREYAEKNVQLLCLPEFALTGYTCSDLFLQDTLLRGAEDGLAAILNASQGLNLVVLVGLPVRCNGKLYNCAAVVCNGELLGLVPKLHLPNYGEFYEKRHFIPGMREPECIELAGQETLIGTNLLFACKQMPAFVLAAEVCEDLWAPVPPSCAHALAGATVVANLSASDETVGKSAYRRALVCGQSARLLCAYLYADAGHGESTTDMTFAGHNLIAENGSLLADTAPFAGEAAVTELDLGRMVQERQRNTPCLLHALRAAGRCHPRRAVRADFAHSGRGPCQADGAYPRQMRCDRHLRRAGQLSGPAGGRARLQGSGPRCQRHCSADDALLRHHKAHPLQRRDFV